jgi:hypothetical protein
MEQNIPNEREREMPISKSNKYCFALLIVGYRHRKVSISVFMKVIQGLAMITSLGLM